MNKITKDISGWEVGGFSIVSVAWAAYELFKLDELGLPPEDVPRVLFILAFISVLVRSGAQKWQAKKNDA